MLCLLPSRKNSLLLLLLSAVRHLVLSQSTRVTDGQTDRRTDRITTPKTALAYAGAVKWWVRPVWPWTLYILASVGLKGFM